MTCQHLLRSTIALGAVAFMLAISSAQSRPDGVTPPSASAPASRPASQPTTAVVAKRVAELILQLDDDNFRKRDQALEALIEIGADAVGPLAEAADSKDIERSARARLAITEIEDRYVRDISTFNPYGVSDGPTKPATFTIKEPGLVTAINTYHFHGGAGATPGTLTLKHDDGTTYGPFKAAAGGGPGADTILWTTKPQVRIKAGSYTVIDSDAATWSHDVQSGNAGFFKLRLLTIGGPAPASTQPSMPWGKPSTGVQARLWTASRGGAKGGIPDLFVDVRNRFRLTFMPSLPDCFEVEIDGTWYVLASDREAPKMPFDKLNPGESCHAWKLPLNVPWLGKESSKRLELSPGKHKLRVAAVGAMDFDGGVVRAESETVQIDVPAPTTQRG